MALEAYRHRLHQVLPLLQAVTSIRSSRSIRDDGSRDEDRCCDNNQKKSDCPFRVPRHSAKTSFILSSNSEEKEALSDYSPERCRGRTHDSSNSSSHMHRHRRAFQLSIPANS